MNLTCFGPHTCHLLRDEMRTIIDLDFFFNKIDNMAQSSKIS